MNIFSLLFGGAIFNFIGASIRWAYGSIWRAIFNQPKFTFKEYLYGPNNSKDFFDKNAHILNNKIIAIFVLGIVFALILVNF